MLVQALVIVVQLYSSSANNVMSLNAPSALPLLVFLEQVALAIQGTI